MPRRTRRTHSPAIKAHVAPAAYSPRRSLVSASCRRTWSAACAAIWCRCHTTAIEIRRPLSASTQARESLILAGNRQTSFPPVFDGL